MIFNKNIRVVARYENKTLLRSWFFRIFAGLALFIIFSMNIGLFSPAGNAGWSFRALPASIPYVNLFIMNLAQAIICVFLASDFLKRDKKLDTTEVLYVRPVTNMEYVWGKTVGIVRLFLGLNLLVLLLGLIFNIVSQDIDLYLPAYLYYLLILSIPTLLFILGFSFFMMSLIRNQAVTFVLLLGYIGANLFYLAPKSNYVFDYLAFQLPMMFSDITGFGDPGLLLQQRLMYLLLGLAFIMASVLMLKRLPQSKASLWTARLSLAVSLLVAVLLFWNQVSHFHSRKKNWEQVIAVNSEYEDEAFTELAEADITISPGRPLEAVASLTLVNTHQENIERILLSLNPGLTVEEVKINAGPVSFERENHLIIIPLKTALAPGARCTAEITYQGIIDEYYSYPELLYEEEVERYAMQMMNISKRYAFQEEDYLLFTPENQWYPVAALNYFPSNPVRFKEDFTRYRLTVEKPEELEVISQGRRNEDGNRVTFTPSTPLTSLSLAVGPYESASVTADSVDFNLYYVKGHDYFSGNFPEIADTLPALLQTIKTEYEAEIGREYPFRELSLVEVPIQFYAHLRKHTIKQAQVQPTMILLPEKGANLPDAGFQMLMEREKRNMERRNQVITDKELQMRVFLRFIRRNFTGGVDFNFRQGRQTITRSKYMVTPNYYYFCNQIDDPGIPVINTVSELKFYPEDQRSQRMQMFTGGLGESEIANLILRESSFEDYLETNPGRDSLNAVMKAKSDYFFAMLQAEPGIEGGDDFFRDFLNGHMFRKTRLDSLTEAYRQAFEYDLKPGINRWYSGGELAGIRLDGLEAKEIRIGNRTRYQVKVQLSNPEEGKGLVRIGFRIAGGGRGMGGNRQGGGNVRAMMGGGPPALDFEQVYRLEPRQSKEIGILLDGSPRRMMINSMVSKNLPVSSSEMFGTVEEDFDVPPFEGERVIAEIPSLVPEGVIRVDNEDTGFGYRESKSINRLRTWLGEGANEGQDNYSSIRSYWPPQHWQPVIQNDFYGEFVHSAVYTKSGAGDRILHWEAEIKAQGYYEVQAYLLKETGTNRMRRFRQDGDEDKERKDYHFRIHHDDGVEELTINLADIEDGWVNLGNYYLSPGTTRVELTNQSTANLVVGDAIQWIKQ